MVKKTKVAVTTVGVDGSAIGTGVTEDVIQGRVIRVDVTYNALAPVTTNLAVRQTNEDRAANIVDLAANNADKMVRPTVQLTNGAGVGLTTGTGPPEDRSIMASACFVSDTLTVTVSECDALTNAVVLEIYYAEN